jgi:hypothetical protein
MLRTMRRLWRDYGLSISLIVLFSVAWALQTWTGWMEFVAERRAEGETAQAFGEDGYLWVWGQATFENWQSEFLQVFVFVVLTTFLVHRRSHESPDTDYDTEAALRRIEARLVELERAPGSGAVPPTDPASSERTVTEEQVRLEHLRQVDKGRHWTYLVGVLVGGTLLMIGLIALLGEIGA